MLNIDNITRMPPRQNGQRMNAALSLGDIDHKVAFRLWVFSQWQRL